jgi:putative endonuclease
MPMTDAKHFVYIVRCADGSLYTGYARDPIARTEAHNTGRGARYTSGRRPVRLVYSEACDTLSAALAREYALKQLSRSDKQALVRQARREHRERAAAARMIGPSPHSSRRKAINSGRSAEL